MSSVAEHEPTSTRAPGDAAAFDGLRLRSLSKRFASFTAVDSLDLDVPRGSFFALLGPSGCGKTTTLRMIAGLDSPSSGTIELAGKDITTSRAHQRPVNTVFQSYALFPHLTIFENVAFGLRRRKVREVKSKVDDMLDLVELGSQRDKKPAQLSGGQQQRVALARALINEPEVLLLDEPLGALDLKLRRAMQIEIKRIQTEVGLTFIHVTHDQEEAMTMADTVAVMNAGRIDQMGAPEELYDLPGTAFVAGFVGQSNLVPATVTGSDGDHLVLDAAGTRVRVPRDRAAVTSGEVLFGVRPEKVTLHAGPSGDSASGDSASGGVRATVVDVSFTGVATQYLVTVPSGGQWTVYEQNLDVEPRRTRPGDEVSLSWNPAHTFVVAADGVPEGAEGKAFIATAEATS